MSDAPERIWADEEDGHWFLDKPHTMDTNEYVLASVADEDRRKLEVAKDVLKHIAKQKVIDGRIYWTDGLAGLLRAAIAEIEGEEG